MNDEQFATLVRQHRGIIGKICFAYSARREDHDDLFQEIVARLWRAFPKFSPDRKFSTWMYRISLNVAIDYRRREAARKRYLPASDRHVETVSSQRDGQVREDAISDLQKAIQRLDELDRALVLMVLEGCSHGEIAEVLGVSESNVGTRFHRLKQRLRRDLNEPTGS